MELDCVAFNDVDRGDRVDGEEARPCKIHGRSVSARGPVLFFASVEDFENLDRTNEFERFCSKITEKNIRDGVISLVYELGRELGFIPEPITPWQTKSGAISQMKETIAPLWVLASAWVVDTLNAESKALLKTAADYPNEYRLFRKAMLARRIVLPPEPPPPKLQKPALKTRLYRPRAR